MESLIDRMHRHVLWLRRGVRVSVAIAITALLNVSIGYAIEKG